MTATARLPRRRAGSEPAAGARAGIAQPRRRGGARGRRRGPQRADGAAARRHRHRHHGAAGGSDPPRQGGRHQGGADRHRARHRDAGGRWRAVRGDHAARGRRDLRPQGQGGVRARLGDATRERRDFTINALSVYADGLVHDYVGGLADLAARRVRFIGDPAQRIAEDLFAHPAVFPLPGVLRPRDAGSRPACMPASWPAKGCARCRASGCARS